MYSKRDESTEHTYAHWMFVKSQLVDDWFPNIMLQYTIPTKLVHGKLLCYSGHINIISFDAAMVWYVHSLILARRGFSFFIWFDGFLLCGFLPSCKHRKHVGNKWHSISLVLESLHYQLMILLPDHSDNRQVENGTGFALEYYASIGLEPTNACLTTIEFVSPVKGVSHIYEFLDRFDFFVLLSDLCWKSGKLLAIMQCGLLHSPYVHT